MSASSDHWTCPQCPPGHGTVVVVGTDADIACCIHAAQVRHGLAHADARRALEPEPRGEAAGDPC